MRPRVFVGSSSEALDVCRSVQEELDHDFDVTVWNQGVFRLSFAALDSLLDALDASDAGIFVLRPDDFTLMRGAGLPVTRDNVLFELGMFMGRLGRARTFMLRPRSVDLHLPSDLDGIVTAIYDDDRFGRGQERAAVAPACTEIAREIRARQSRPPKESASQARLDEAMRHLSADLRALLRSRTDDEGAPDGVRAGNELLSMQIGRARVRVELGRIEDYAKDDSQLAIALPANEYFDDECISDPKSALGAFVDHHFDDVEGVVADVRTALTDLPAERVMRTGDRADFSYGVGQTLRLKHHSLGCHVVLVAATTERPGIGLRAEPHFLYAAVDGVVRVSNERRLASLVMPVFGSGHGGVPVPIALLFNLLAIKRALNSDAGRMLREITVVVFDRDAGFVVGAPMADIRAHLDAGDG
jgi:hypothetical protein